MKITIDLNEETGELRVDAANLDMISVLGMLELAKHTITHSETHSKEEHEETNVEAVRLIGKGGHA